MLKLKDQKLLVVAPHPDDEVLGCGGLIKKIKQAGGNVSVLYLTVGDTQDYSASGKSTSSQRISEIKKVAKFLDFDDWEIALEGNDYHLQLDKVPQLKLISIIDKYIAKLTPTILATTQSYDYNQDHIACAKAVAAATRPAPLEDRYIPNIIMGYHSVVTAGWAQIQVPNPNFYLQLNKHDLAAKAQALGLYTSQVRENGHQRTPEAVEKIARVWGMHAGTEYAESYFIHKFFTPIVSGGKD